jgi:Cu2+-exporting ATPase
MSPPSGAEAALDDPLALARYTRFEQSAGACVAESSLRIGGMHCAACAGQIEDAVRAVDGVLGVEVSAAAQCARVRWDPDRTRASVLVAAITGAGYEAAPDIALEARALREREARRMLWRSFVAVFCAMQVMMLAAPAYLSGPGELAPDLRDLLNRASWLLTLPVLMFSAGPMFAGALRALRTRRITMDVPVVLGILACFLASSVAAFDPGGAFGATPYFDSLTMFVAFLLVGRQLELRARHRAARMLEDAAGALPETARRLDEDGRAETVSIHRLAPGDRLQVALGEAFAADGLILEGRTTVDESLLNGEARPVARGPGDAIAAGSINLGAPVTMRAERVGADTRHEAIVGLMREAATQRPASARAVDRWAGHFLWGVLALAAAAGLAWHWIDPPRAAWVAVSVLIVTCPCALSLATPTALLAATSRLARRGFMLRRLEALETLATVRHVFIDKTGTLTGATPAWRACTPLAPMPQDEQARLLARAAQLAAHSRHPLARALAEAVPAAAGATTRWTRVREFPGRGLQARDEADDAWRFGSAEWVGGAPVPMTGADIAPGTHTFFGPRGRPLLRLDFDETPRPGALEAVRAWQARGMRVTLLSGDDAARTRALAQRLGLDDAIGAATPERKLQALDDAQRRGECVAMLGDGLNDAPVLARADVSVAMPRGAALARGSADAVLLSERLEDVVEAGALARRTMRVIRQNIAWGIAYNAACVPLALAGLLPPWAAGLGMSLSSLAVVGNSLRLAR